MGPTRNQLDDTYTPKRTVEQVDAALNRARLAYLVAENNGDLTAADLAYKVLDELLDTRFHTPQQRPPTT